MTKEQIIETWTKVFPHSHVSVQTSVMGINAQTGTMEGKYVNAFIAATKNEVSNNIWLNDILSYSFSIDVNNKYEEDSLSILINPTEKYLAYSRARIRKKSITNITPVKLEERFKQVRQLLIDNVDNLPSSLTDLYDIDVKLNLSNNYRFTL